MATKKTKKQEPKIEISKNLEEEKREEKPAIVVARLEFSLNGKVWAKGEEIMCSKAQANNLIRRGFAEKK